MQNSAQSNIIEIFYSLSGEGITVGVPTIFIRLAGCSLRCGKTDSLNMWCDTGYALSYEKGTAMTVEEVISKTNSFSGNKIQHLITGGEPLEATKRDFVQELANLIYEKNRGSDFELTRIETNGKELVTGLEHMVFSIDYKLPGSGMEQEMNPENFFYIAERKHPLDEIKFVVRNRNDFDHSLSVITRFGLENFNLVYSPVHGELVAADLADWIKNTGLAKSRLSLQLHKILWGDKKGV